MEIWGKVGRGILRSSAFLATYCALAWGGACTGFAARGQLDPVGLSISCWTGKDPHRCFPKSASSQSSSALECQLSLQHDLFCSRESETISSHETSLRKSVLLPALQVAKNSASCNTRLLGTIKLRFNQPPVFISYKCLPSAQYATELSIAKLRCKSWQDNVSI